jgi:outer membrane protein W
MKRIFPVATLLLMTAAFASAQTGIPRKPIEFSLFGGVSFGANTWTTRYGDAWSYYNLANVVEETLIEAYHKLGFAGGVYATYFFTPSLGVQVMAGGLHESVPNTSYLEFAWRWIDDVDNVKSHTWEGTGSLTSLPLCLNLAARLGKTSVQGAFSGGLSLFLNTFKADSTFGYGVTLIEQVYVPPNMVTTQYLDALPVKLKIPSTSWTSWGANLGAGLDILAGRSTSIKVDVRYFFSFSKTLTWDYVFGNYNGIFFTKIAGYPFDEDDAALLAANGKTFTMKVNPSFFYFSVGVVFHLGATKRI